MKAPFLSSPWRPSRTDLAALALSLLAVAAARTAAVDVFEELPHLEDEFAYLWQAQVMAGGSIAIASPPDPESFLVPFVVDYQGWRFGKYPPGWPAALALGSRLGAPYWVNPLLAGLAVWLSYRLASRLAGVWAGLMGAFLTGASPMVLMLAGSLMPHLWTVVLTLGFALAWMDLFVRPDAAGGPGGVGLRLAVAGLGLGVIALTRPLTAVGVALPFAAHSVILLWTRRENAARRLAWIAGLALGVVALMPLWQWALTGNPWQNLYALWWPYDRVGFGPGIGVLPEGHSLGQAWINTRLSLAAFQHDLFGWPYLSWVFVPVGLWALRRRGEAWLGGAIFPSLATVYLAYWVSSWVLGPRYFVEAAPMLAAVSAAGIAWLGRGSRARRRLVGVAAGLMIALNLMVYLPIRLGGLHGLYGIDRAALEAFEAVAPERGLVIVARNPYWHGYGNLVTLTPPFGGGPLLALERGALAEARLRMAFPGLPFYAYDPGRPGRLVELPGTGQG